MARITNQQQENTMKTIKHLLIMSSLLLFVSLLNGQEMIIKSRVENIFRIPEISAMIAENDNKVTVMFAMGKQQRQKKYRSVDIRKNDEILFLNGKRIKKVAAFKAIYDSLKVDDEVKIGIKRDGKRFITSFVKADAADLPQTGMIFKTTMGGADGTEEMKDMEKGAIKMSFSGDPENMKPFIEFGIIARQDGDIVKVAKVLPPPINSGEVKLEDGDFIKAVNGKKITSLESLTTLYAAIKVGSDVTLDIVRKGKEKKISFKKTEKKKRTFMKMGNDI